MDEDEERARRLAEIEKLVGEIGEVVKPYSSETVMNAMVAVVAALIYTNNPEWRDPFVERMDEGLRQLEAIGEMEIDQ